MTPSNLWDSSNIMTATPFQMTTLEWVIANQKIALQAQANTLNANLIKAYYDAWATYDKNRDDRPAAVYVEPTPGHKWILDQDENGNWGVIQGAEEVCPRSIYTAPVTHNLQPGQSMLGVPGTLTSAASLFNNSVPLYVRPITAPDGSQWVRVS